MKNLKKDYIRDIFERLDSRKEEGIYFSGIFDEGEFKQWYKNGQLKTHGWWKNGKLEGEETKWNPSGSLYTHSWFSEYQCRIFPKDVKLKKGYILGGDGKYYKD